MMFANRITYFLILCCVHYQVVSENITSIEKLREAILSSSNKRVGFFASYLYEEVKTALPFTTQVVFCDGKSHFGLTCDNMTHLSSLVDNGDLLAGILEEEYYTSSFGNMNVFPSNVIISQVMLMAPDKSEDVPHGAPPDRSSNDLALAINAAIVRLQKNSLDRKIKLEYLNYHLHTSVGNFLLHTCKTKDDKSFPIPNKVNATGLLKKILDTKVLTLGLGNSVLLLQDLFWIKIMKEISNEFNGLSGPDGVVYGPDITLKGLPVQSWVDSDIYAAILDGEVDISMPFHNADEEYTGTWESCFDKSDCRPALLMGGTELCTTYTDFYEPDRNETTGERKKRCEHPLRPIWSHFRLSCSMMGVNRHFFTKKIIQAKIQRPSYTVMGIGIGVPVGIALLSIILLGMMCHMERKGTPWFM